MTSIGSVSFLLDRLLPWLLPMARAAACVCCAALGAGRGIATPMALLLLIVRLWWYLDSDGCAQPIEGKHCVSHLSSDAQLQEALGRAYDLSCMMYRRARCWRFVRPHKQVGQLDVRRKSLFSHFFPSLFFLSSSTGRARPSPGDMPALRELLCFCSVCLTSKGSPQEKQITLSVAQPDF